MTVQFTSNDGALQSIRFRIVNATPFVVVDTTDPNKGGQIQIASFEVNENSGGTPSLTVDIYNPTDMSLTYLSSGGVTYKAKPLTALQGVLFDRGYVIPNGCQLRVTSNSSSGLLDVVGVKLGRSGRPV